MSTSADTAISRERDPWSSLGRGLTMLLALALPYLPALERLKLPGGFPVPVVSVLAFLVALTAVVRVFRIGLPLRRGWGVAAVLFLLVAVSGIGMRARGGDVPLGIATVYSAFILVAAVAVHYSGQPVERIGVLIALLLSGFTAAVLALGQSLGIPAMVDLSTLFSHGQDTWSLLPRANGPMETSEVLAWVLAVLLPVAVAGVVALKGWRRELVALLVALLWWALLATYSLIAPLAALGGILIVLMSRISLRQPYTGVALALLLGTLVAILDPALRARWSRYPAPINMVVRSVTTIDDPAADDSLYFTVVNPGPLPWPKGYEIGYHLLYPSVQGEMDEGNLMKGGWVSRTVQERVPVGRQFDVTLPFAGTMRRGLITPDLRGPTGLLSTENGLRYTFLYGARDEFGLKRVEALLPINDPGYLAAVQQVLERGEHRKHERSREEVLRDAFSLMQAKPLFGLGPGATEALLGYSSRSMYIETAVAYGWVGIVVLFLLLATMNMGLLAKGTLETTALSGALLSAAIYGISAYVHDNLSVVVLSALLFGLAWAAAFGPEPEDAG